MQSFKIFVESANQVLSIIEDGGEHAAPILGDFLEENKLDRNLAPQIINVVNRFVNFITIPDLTGDMVLSSDEFSVGTPWRQIHRAIRQIFPNLMPEIAITLVRQHICPWFTEFVSGFAGTSRWLAEYIQRVNNFCSGGLHDVSFLETLFAGVYFALSHEIRSYDYDLNMNNSAELRDIYRLFHVSYVFQALGDN